jgi:LysM repeat protein
MRAQLVSLLLFLCLLLDNSAAQAQANPVDELIQRVNALRAAYGVPAYQVDYALMYAAQAEAEWGLANMHFGHDGPGGSTPDERAKAAGYGTGENSFTVENVAAGTASLNTPELVVSMWQNDRGHLTAMISADYENVGVGFAEADGFSFYVMMVGWAGTKGSIGETKGSTGETQDQEIPLADTPGTSFIISQPDESGAIYHEVQPGQTAWTIAAQYNVDLAELLKLNGLTADSILHPGDVLTIRAPDPPTSTPTVTPTSLPATGIPTKTPPPVQATEDPIGSDALTIQNQERDSNDSARSNVYSVSLVVGVGAILLASVIFVIRSQKS